MGSGVTGGAATVGVSDRVIVVTGGVTVVAGGKITESVGPPGLSVVTVTTGAVGCAATGSHLTVAVYFVPVNV